ncbi:hypothetical protein [Alcanivorax sp.]|uniref:hypothetical protein n=1 Tax=Alcanivorax sp. TaxID=1872427 RepID=UPI0032D8D85A
MFLLKKTKLLPFLILLMLPNISWAFVGTSLQTGHSAYCNLGLAKSLIERKKQFNGWLGALNRNRFSDIKDHNHKLRQMNDEQYKRYMVGEVGSVAFCHPVSSSLIGGLPGDNYLSVVNTFTKIPSSIDRKITYSIWGYGALYRSWHQFTASLLSKVPTMPSWDQERYMGDLEFAQNQLKELRSLSLDQLIDTNGLSQKQRTQLERALSDIKLSMGGVQSDANYNQSRAGANHQFDRLPSEDTSEEDRSTAIGDDVVLWPDFENASVKSEENELDVDSSYSRDGLNGKDLDYIDIANSETAPPVLDESEADRPPIKPLRPTITAYTIVGEILYIHDFPTMQLLLPSSLGPKNACFERFLPEYPRFARLLTQGMGRLAAKVKLNAPEQSEILRFFRSASGVDDASSFMIFDETAVVKRNDSPSTSLLQCLSLVENTSSQQNHRSLFHVNEGAVIDGSRWLSGLKITFSEDDPVWQSLMAMLALKRIESSYKN